MVVLANSWAVMKILLDSSLKYIEVSMVPTLNVVSNFAYLCICTVMAAPNILFSNKASIFALRQEIYSIIIHIVVFGNAGDCFGASRLEGESFSLCFCCC